MLLGLMQVFVSAAPIVTVVDIQDEMNELLNELIEIDRNITSYPAVERYEVKYLSHHKLMDACFDAYSAEIRENHGALYQIYEDYQALYARIGKRIDVLKQNEAKRIEAERIKAKLENYCSEMNELHSKAKVFCDKKKSDSLEKAKSRANTVFNQVTVIQGSNAAVFENNDILGNLVDSIGKSHDEINALSIRKSRFWDILFKIIVVIGIVMMAGNIVSSKISMMKSMKPSVKKPAPIAKSGKNNEEEFSI